MNDYSALSKLIIQDSTTKLEALRKVRLLRDFFNFTLFNQTGSKDEAVKNFITHQQQEIAHLSQQKVEEFNHGKSLLLALDKAFLESVTAKNYKKLMDQLEIDIKDTQTIIFYLPFEIPEKEVAELGNYVKKNINPSFLIDISYKESLIGGCSISYKGQIKDYSLKHKIEANRETIIKSLSSFKS